MKLISIVLASLLLVGAAPRPKLPIRPKKRLAAPATHGATLLLFAPAAPLVWHTNVLTFRYAPSVSNNPARFDWAIDGSYDLTNWFIVVYPVTNDSPVVFQSNNVPKMFLRSRRRN